MQRACSVAGHLMERGALKSMAGEGVVDRGKIKGKRRRIGALPANAAQVVPTDIVRARFVQPAQTLRELFSRLVFNVLVGNIDDHARNHAAFWNGSQLELTPAYDICPQTRTGREANQAMRVHNEDRRSQLDVCLAAAPHFLLSDGEAEAIVADLIGVIRSQWDTVCAEAGLTQVDKAFMWRRQFLNPYAFQDGGEAIAAMGAGIA